MPPSIESFEFHGFVQQGKSGNQIIGQCPFCLKDKHFYINEDNLLWDCKVCLLSGSFNTFLHQIAEGGAGAMEDAHWKTLAINRQLPRSAFKDWGIGYNGLRFTLPVLDREGKVINIRTFRLNGNFITTKGVGGSLFGLQHYETTGPIYLTEGEWDAIALRYMMKKLKKPGVVLGVPGANSFSQQWVGWFQDRVVYALYDNDDAGAKGAELCKTRLAGVAKRLSIVKWPSTEQPGFDTRDWVVRAVQKKNLQESWDKLHELFQDDAPTAAAPSAVPSTVVPITFDAACLVYNKWLSLQNNDAIKVLFGTCFANRLDGDPVWMFLVGVPGSAKSELLMSLSGSDEVISKSTLTAASLLSGWGLTAGSVDHSLIPKLDGKILVVKDFTAVLNAASQERDQIFGLLRDAFDGKIEKSFGTGSRSYVSKFGIIAGTTPIINSVAAMQQTMGERFLKFAMDEGDPEVKIRAAIANIDQETQMRSEMQLAAAGVMANNPAKPAITEKFINKVVALARYCALLRGTVDRERYSNLVTHRPSAEIGTRVAKQLTKLAMGISMVTGSTEITDEDYRIVKDIAICSCPDRSEVVVRCLFAGKEMTSLELTKVTRLPKDTINRVVGDLNLLRCVTKVGLDKGYWKLSDEMVDYITRGEIYAVQ